MTARMTPEKAIAKYVHPGEPNECWPWLGPRHRRGYGAARIGGRQYGAHRVAYELAKGPIPSGLLVRHACDNPPCCNPAHLLVGTNQDNTDDRVNRNRQTIGEASPRARLTERQVVEIRNRYARGESSGSLAREFGVSKTVARGVVTGRGWKHVAGPISLPRDEFTPKPRVYPHPPRFVLYTADRGPISVCDCHYGEPCDYIGLALVVGR